mmetsp:Transcript_7340/g.11502  ORF Transcript_7340/g.11502 Transcript_7340/m.11502 type:complete len:106 (+) Transcript_7340:190-507(+)
MFSDPRQERFVSKQEEKILTENQWPDGMKKFFIEGHIVLARVDERTVFFNSKFETGNLRQVFRGDNLDPASFYPESSGANPAAALEPVLEPSATQNPGDNLNSGS